MDGFTGMVEARKSLSLRTVKKYREVISALKNQAEKEGLEPTAAGLIEIYIRRSPSLAFGYWQVVTAALKDYVASQTEMPVIEALNRIEEADRPTPWSTKAEGILPDSRFTIEERIRSGATKSQYDGVLVALLRAGVLTGLRPNEWLTSKIVEIDGCKWLQVETAKTKKDEAPIRHLGIHRFPTHDLAVVEELVETASSIGQDWPMVVASASRLFRETARAAGLPASLRLYCCRHQFSANAKSRLEPKAVSALMGHLSTGITKKYAGPFFSEIGGTFAEGAHVVTALPDCMQEEVDRVVDSTKVGGRRGRGAPRLMGRP